jgi:hypothetical protein
VQTLKQLQDIKIDRSDFVLQHKNTKFNEIYNVKENDVLGQGGFGKVLKCFHKETGEVRAVKLISKE